SKDNILKCEYFLPFVVDDLLKEGKARVKVLDTKEKWYGVTYRADKQAVCDALQAKRDAGIYPQHLY
ncbi:MAG: nucleotidyltransferase, partial [Oscillospiraceae bacterium]|nr:nucleotidyltransferase [Oscillospiraceae bacterium]